MTWQELLCRAVEQSARSFMNPTLHVAGKVSMTHRPRSMTACNRLIQCRRGRVFPCAVAVQFHLKTQWRGLGWFILNLSWNVVFNKDWLTFDRNNPGNLNFGMAVWVVAHKMIVIVIEIEIAPWTPDSPFPLWIWLLGLRVSVLHF